MQTGRNQAADLPLHRRLAVMLSGVADDALTMGLPTEPDAAADYPRRGEGARSTAANLPPAVGTVWGSLLRAKAEARAKASPEPRGGGRK